jgi:hypothetical protein
MASDILVPGMVSSQSRHPDPDKSVRNNGHGIFIYEFGEYPCMFLSTPADNGSSFLDKAHIHIVIDLVIRLVFSQGTNEHGGACALGVERETMGAEGASSPIQTFGAGNCHADEHGARRLLLHDAG